MSVTPAVKQKLFVLRVVTTDPGKAIADNSDKLNKDLDRGWQVGSYEVILADADLGICHVLVRLTTPILATPAVPPATAPALVPPPSKLFVLRTSSGDPDSFYNDQVALAKEIDRGWLLDCYEVVLSSPVDHSCFILVKLNNSGTLAAMPPSS